MESSGDVKNEHQEPWRRIIGEWGGRGEARQDRQEYQQLLWRAEDKNQTFFERGFQMDDLVKPEDIINMGRAHALMIIQRSGAARMDLIRVG